MHALLYGVLAWAMAGLIPRLLVGAGLTLVVYSGISVGVGALLQQAASYIGGAGGAVAQLALLAGVGEFLSIIGSALLTRVGLVMAGNIAGLRRVS